LARTSGKLKWLQNPSKINEDNLSNGGCEVNKHFLNKKQEYPNARIKELETNNKNIRDLYRGIN
jgi:hypothetical protein